MYVEMVRSERLEGMKLAAKVIKSPESIDQTM